ncbi:MAG: polysulfide reductase NrfD [Desulfitobacterium sp.]|nr:polysulfide reductase NrfD [Desulfitobacterium sp.]
MTKKKYQANLWTYLSLILIAFALAGAGNKYFISGEHAFGISPEVPWGALISGYVFFAVAATGTGLVGSLAHVFRIKKFEVLSRRALLASILLLISGFAVLAVELSNPFKMIHMLFTPNLNSPIFWMGAFYGVYLILLFGEFYFSLKDKHSIATGIAYVSFFVKLAAITNLGRVFAYTAVRDFWSGYYYPAYMIVSAIVSGAAVLLIIVHLTSKDKAEKEDLGKTLSQILAGSLILFAIMQGAKVGLSLNSADGTVAAAASALVSGPMALPFWGMEVIVGIVAPVALLFGTKFSSLSKSFWASILTMLGLVFSRIDFVYAGQVVPLNLLDNTVIPSFNSYAPTWSEWSLIIGALGFIYLAFSFLETKLTLDVTKGEEEYYRVKSEGYSH